MMEKIVIYGGTGRIGTAVAIHLLSQKQDGPFHVVLAGRDELRGQLAVKEVMSACGGSNSGGHASFAKSDYQDPDSLRKLVSSGISAVINTAGPFLDVQPLILAAAIDASVACYVDVADPTEYLNAALALAPRAAAAGTRAVIAAGAFPGLSNLLAMEAAATLRRRPGGSGGVHNLRFNYFTAGLGGSGPVNLYITNRGFGELVETFDRGSPRAELTAGLEPQRVRFYLDPSDASRGMVGEDVVTWLWPFPEGRTVAARLGITGESRVAMGTAPHVWNVVLGALVRLVPRGWWRSRAFAAAMAAVSAPMVALTDRLVGQTHAMRVEAEDGQGWRAVAVQAHDSFRTCVGQSCAEFALHLLRSQNSAVGPGVHLPEDLCNDEERERLAARLTTTPGTRTFRLALLPPPDPGDAARVQGQ